VHKFSVLGIIQMGNLLMAMKSGSSFTWQSIIHGMQAFNRGCIWGVGEGDQINIWEDPWIPTSPTRKVYNSKRFDS
jgi:hypothetical protein